MATLETQYSNYLKDNSDSTFTLDQWKEWHSNNIRQALIQIMKDDEELGLYDETSKCACGHTITCDCGPKQETLEEAADRLNTYVLNGRTPFKEGFKDGAKWQQERSYSEEEVKNIVDETIEKFYKHFYTLTKAEMKEQWFEQFKKK